MQKKGIPSSENSIFFLTQLVECVVSANFSDILENFWCVSFFQSIPARWTQNSLSQQESVADPDRGILYCSQRGVFLSPLFATPGRSWPQELCSPQTWVSCLICTKENQASKVYSVDYLSVFILIGANKGALYTRSSSHSKKKIRNSKIWWTVISHRGATPSELGTRGLSLFPSPQLLQTRATTDNQTTHCLLQKDLSFQSLS